jgi:protein-S-isoprenylcysteine O-methyltransferase Ste14
MESLMKNIVPLLLSIILIGLIALFLIFRLGHGAGWVKFLSRDVLFTAAYISWIFAEFTVSKREIGQGDRTRDYGTCGLYAVGQSAVFLSALFFAPTGTALNAAHVLGFAIFLSGVLFRLWAIRTLGRYYSHIVREVTDHKIVDWGPYRIVRHPAYLGMIVANIGVTVFFFNVVTLCLLFFLLIPSIIIRILIEERMLYSIEGYKAFAEGRKRLVPGVW